MLLPNSVKTRGSVGRHFILGWSRSGAGLNGAPVLQIVTLLKRKARVDDEDAGWALFDDQLNPRVEELRDGQADGRNAAHARVVRSDDLNLVWPERQRNVGKDGKVAELVGGNRFAIDLNDNLVEKTVRIERVHFDFKLANGIIDFEVSSIGRAENLHNRREVF